MSRGHKTNFDPAFQQGKLDGLCGIYAPINALSICLDGHIDHSRIFKACIEGLGGNSTITVILNGMTTAAFLKNLDVVAGAAHYQSIHMSYRRAFKRSDAPLRDWWRIVGAHIRENGPGTVLIRLGGQQNHWTCIRTISASEIILADSDGLTEFSRHTLTTKMQTISRPNVLFPSQTFLMKTERIELRSPKELGRNH